MSSKTPSNKRPREDFTSERPNKRPFGTERSKNDSLNDPKPYKFRILLPNGTSLEVKMNEMRNEMPIEKFINVVRSEYYFVLKQRSKMPARKINWEYRDLHFTDAHSNIIRTKVNFRVFKPKEWHFMWLHDGSAEPDAYEDMWDLTPDTDLLKELPDDYTFETALADLIDNSLQALWSNNAGERRLISLEWRPDRITIFDSGPGMDGADGNLVKWGKMGASLHRLVRGKAIGGEPPYLMPFFGMFGYGGPIAAMCLGRRAVVSSKTKNCNKVFTLHLEREVLTNASRSENCWKTKGGKRDPLDDEIKKSPHRSFTKVEIFEPKMKSLNIRHFRCKLKDIYFPYIQCDEISGKTSRPIEFKVNGRDLAGIQGGEVATTNLHSCNGREFILQLHFSMSQESSSSSSQSQRVILEANARLKCVYFPIIEGKESIQMIIDKLQEDGYEIKESFEGCNHVSVRRLGRLLPDARWAWLPFMEPKQKKGEKAQILKRCFSRVKCFIDTDSGFNPTPYKTDLAQHHPYTKALKNFGNKMPENEKGLQVEVFKDGKGLTLTQLDKLYNDWVLEMHEHFDEEIDGGLDEPTLVIVSSKIKKLGTSAPVLRVHKKIARKGKNWTAGQRLRIMKGACAGCHKTNIYATLEYIILEGLQGDACGEARLIIRPLGVPEEKGCHLMVENGNKTIELRESLSFPISVIDSGKCTAMDENEWTKKLDMRSQKLPSFIDLLTDKDCHALNIDGGLLHYAVEAGDSPPERIIAIVRPNSYNARRNYKSFEQRFIVRDNIDMNLEVKFSADDSYFGPECEHVFTMRVSPSSHKGIHGLYIFPLKVKYPKLFHKAGFYKFYFSLNEPRNIRLEQLVQVLALDKVCTWKFVSQEDPIYTVRIGSYSRPICIVCSDRYNNNIVFSSIPKLTIKLISSSKNIILSELHGMKVEISRDQKTMIIKDIIVSTGNLHEIRPNYEAELIISSVDKSFSMNLRCKVLPGNPRKIVLHPHDLRKELTPGRIIENLRFEVFDACGNHIEEDENILVLVDGFSFEDGTGISCEDGVKSIKKVDANGCVDLSNILKVSKGYGRQDVSIMIQYQEKKICKILFETEARELRTVSKVFKNCEVGSQLENISFEVVNPGGEIDESIHDEDKDGQSHTLTLKSDSFDVDDTVRFSFRHGICCIRSIPLPHTEGIFFISASHSRYPELNLDLEIHVTKIQNHENLLIPYTGSFEDSERVNGNFSTQRSNGNGNLSPFNCSTLKTPKTEHDDDIHEKIDILPINVSASQKEIEDDLEKSYKRMRRCCEKLETLNSSRAIIEQRIIDLQACRDKNSHNEPETCVIEDTRKQIESAKPQSAAAIICKMHEKVPFEERSKSDYIGIVALLGTVQSIELSRMLARYIGEEQMLAIVCTNYAAGNHLQTNTIPEFAAKSGLSLPREFLMFCIEDIRPIKNEPSSGPEEPLLLPMPKSSNGDLPQGFLGHAVNLIGIDSSFRTQSGHSLRETLFYRLFGDLQVYKDRNCMMKATASSCCPGGAISLDGGIVRDGLLVGGHWEPAITFPVKNRSLSSQSLEMMESNKELIKINHKIDKKKKALEIESEKFEIARNRYNMMVPRNGPSPGIGSSQQYKSC